MQARLKQRHVAEFLRNSKLAVSARVPYLTSLPRRGNGSSLTSRNKTQPPAGARSALTMRAGSASVRGLQLLAPCSPLPAFTAVNSAHFARHGSQTSRGLQSGAGNSTCNMREFCTNMWDPYFRCEIKTIAQQRVRVRGRQSANAKLRESRAPRPFCIFAPASAVQFYGLARR